MVTESQPELTLPPVVDDAAGQRRVMVTTLTRVGRYICILLLLWVCFRYLLGLSLTYFPESDGAFPLLAAQDMLHGNWILRGWSISTDSFWLTDNPFYVVGVALKGLTPALMDEIPTTTYVGMLVLATVAILSLHAGRVQQGSRAIAVMAGLLPLLFPSYALGRFVLKGTYHVSTTAFVLGSFLLMHYALLSGRTPRSTRLMVAAAGILGAAMVSDPMAAWIGLIPAILTSCVLLYRNRRLHWPALVPASIAITGWLTAKIILGILHVVGGFTLVAGQVAAFVDFSGLGGNISLFVQGILDLFGANFFGLFASIDTLPVLLRLLGCVAVMVSILFTLRDVCEHDDQLSVLLAVGAAVIAAAFIFSAVPRPVAGERFLVPLVIFGSVLLGRRAWRLRIPTGRREGIIIVILALAITGLYALAPVTRLRHPAPTVGKFVTGANDWPSMNALGSWLVTHGLHEGYGPYQAASIVTVATRGAVVVRHVTANHPWVSPYDEILRSDWDSKCSWYRDPSVRFVIARENWDNVNLRTATFTFGPPSAIYTAAGFTIFEWPHPIMVKSPATQSSSRRQRIIQRLVKIAPMFRFLHYFVEPPCT